MNKKISIGSDHAGYELKEYLKQELLGGGFEFKDYGTHGTESVDYPDFAHPVAESIENGEVEMAIVICGSGNGINMTANKHQAVRSALCWNKEIALLARQHNNANVLALPARYISKEAGKSIALAFLNEAFEGGRHERRVKKI